MNICEEVTFFRILSNTVTFYSVPHSVLSPSWGEAEAPRNLRVQQGKEV